MHFLGLLAALVFPSVGGCTGSEPAQEEVTPRPPEQRPTLALLTSLPLVFGESFGLDGGGSPALTRIELRYNVVPIGVADAKSLANRKLLLMAHPRAQPAEVLVDLDQWVRQGGRVLLLADPKLDWPSELPLGDKLRPAPAFADTGLLKHWGLKLAGPAAGETAGRLIGREHCQMTDDGVVARCRIGRGNATIIGDADFINVESSDDNDLDLLIAELARLETR